MNAVARDGVEGVDVVSVDIAGVDVAKVDVVASGVCVVLASRRAWSLVIGGS